jgi:hypothetical protein
MDHVRSRTAQDGRNSPDAGRAALDVPGKRTLTMSLASGAAAPIQAKLRADGASGAVEPAEPAARSVGAGDRMPEDVQGRMERAFGMSFSAVRIHESPEVEAHGALAYARGADVHFAPGQYRPHSPAGQALLGHELAHVVQQADGRATAPAQAKGAGWNHDPGLERDADEMGERAASGLPVNAAARDTTAPRALASATAEAAQGKLAATGLAVELDVSSPEKLADAIIDKIGAKPAYGELVATHGADAVRTQLIDMINSVATDHGAFNLATGLGASRLVSALGKQFPAPVFALDDVVQDSQAVGYVVEINGERVRVQWVRRSSDSEESQSYLTEPPEWAEARALRASTATIARERQRPRAPHARMEHVGSTAFGDPVRPPSQIAEPSRPVTDALARGPLRPAPDRDHRVAPKDLSFVPTAMHMQFNARDKPGAAHIEQMALIGHLEGFRVTLLVAESELGELKFVISEQALTNITINVCETPPAQWAEDSGEHHLGGSVHVPNRASNIGLASPEDAIRTGRDDRGFYLHGRDRDDSDIRRIGASVASKSSQKDTVATGIADRAPNIVENRSYIEGGNLLTGTHANGLPFALIGMDALYATRKQILPRRAGVATNEDTVAVTKLVSQEIGIAVERIYFVEQPGEFHLDMKLAVMGPGQVLVNDAFEVFDLQQDWILADYQAKRGSMPEPAWQQLYPAIDRELAELSTKARTAWAYETRTIRQLSRIPDLTIERVAANFPGTRSLPTMNFLNGEGGRGRDDSPFFVTNGGDRRAEAYIAQMYLTELKTGLRRLYFLDPGFSEMSLAESGGIGCRTKGEGTTLTGS